MNSLQINKEQLSDLNFPYNDVLSTRDEQHVRLEKLKTALVLGNGFKHKVKIVFHDTTKKNCVETTVWFVNDTHVIFKGGLIMPVTCIEDVFFT